MTIIKHENNTIHAPQLVGEPQPKLRRDSKLIQLAMQGNGSVIGIEHNFKTAGECVRYLFEKMIDLKINQKELTAEQKKIFDDVLKYNNQKFGKEEVKVAASELQKDQTILSGLGVPGLIQKAGSIAVKAWIGANFPSKFPGVLKFLEDNFRYKSGTKFSGLDFL